MTTISEKEKVAAIMREASGEDSAGLIRHGIEAATARSFLKGRLFLEEAMIRISRDREKGGTIPPAALSYYGLCLAMDKGHFKEAVDYCERALKMEFYNPDHYANLSQVWLQAGNRKKGVEALARGLAMEPTSRALINLQAGIGVRGKPAIAFLERDNPLNVSLGKVKGKLSQKKTG